MTKAEMLALARMRMAHGGKTLVPIADAAKICDVKLSTLEAWVLKGQVPNEPNAKRERKNAVIVDLGAVLTVRDSSRLHPEGSPISYRAIADMRLVAAGLTYQEIANRTAREFSTVQEAVRRACGKLGTHSRAAAVVRCLKLRLFVLDEIEDLPNPMKEQNPGIV